jgi:hypothetical protein
MITFMQRAFLLFGNEIMESFWTAMCQAASDSRRKKGAVIPWGYEHSQSDFNHGRRREKLVAFGLLPKGLKQVSEK